MCYRSICRAAIVLSTSFGIATAVDADMLSPSALQGKKIMFVAGDTTDEKSPSDDPLVKQHLRDMGFAVMESRGDALPNLAGVDLIVISATADPFRLSTAYRDASVPIFTWNQSAYPDLGMTGSTAHVDFEIISTELPLQGGRLPASLYGYGANTTHEIARAVGLRDRLFGLYFLRFASSGWGNPGTAATIIADTEGVPSHGALFVYEKGAFLHSRQAAPARRVGFWLAANSFHELSQVDGPAANDPNIRDWNVGLRLFDASIRWAVSPSPEASPPSPSLAKGKKLLFVARTDGLEGAEQDVHMAAHFSEMGFEVTWRDQSATEEGADSYDLIILSSTNSKWKLANKYLNTTAALLCLDGLMVDGYRMAGRVRFTDYGEHGEEGEDDDLPADSIRIVNPLHPLAGGLTGVSQYLKEPSVVKWATPAASAMVIATLPDAPNQVAIFAYEKGATMMGYFVAPGRRAFFSLDNPDFDNLSPAGLALLESNVLWMVR